MRTLQNFARILIGPVFIFSGFVKAVDPLGYTYKITDYLEAFGLDFLTPLAMVAAIFFSTLEIAVGISLIMGILMRITSWVLLIFMSFFTILTFILALTNPVTDCGCFGDALVITNWQTFWKNIILMVPTLIVFFNRFSFRPFSEPQNEWGILTLFVTLAVVLSIVCYNNLPFLDFRPYKVGTHIPTSMTIPDDAEMDEYESTFIYEKNGEKKEFTVESIPYEDTNWKFVEGKSELIKKGYEPPIHDFSIATSNGGDITDSVLTNDAYTFLIISYKLEKADINGLKKVNNFVSQIKDKASVVGLTASTNNIIESTIKELGGIEYDYHAMDEITLKTIVRSNPGVLLLKDGTVIGKWHYKNLPEKVGEKENIMSLAAKEREAYRSSWVNAFFLVSLFALIVFLVLLARRH